MAVEFSEVIYNTTAIWVAPLASDNSYGTPAFLERGQGVKFEFEMDTDQVMSYGLLTDILAIAKNGKGELGSAALEFAALNIMTADTPNPSGTTPNQVSDIDFSVGGAGLPFFGMVVTYASTHGGNVIAGFPKCMLDAIPPYEVEQNKFRVGTTGFRFVAPSTTIRKLCRIRKNETAASPPSDAGGFDTFFADFFDA